MATKLAEGDTICTQGEVTMVHEDGTVTVRLHGFDYPVTVSAEHLSLIAKKKAGPGPRHRAELLPRTVLHAWPGAGLRTSPQRQSS
jgi:hypothetical protein